MKFTRKDILEMDESQLRLQVLKPLFERMGFIDVFHHHGGISEKGKDFVMWKSGELGERVNFAVVVKIERVTGKANAGSGTAGSVATQIQQSFGCNFLDPVTSEQQRVNKCWIFSSKEISKEAIESIKSILANSNLDRNVVFMDGDHLWKLIQENFPECAALENIQQAAKIFENMDKDWRIAVSTKGGKNSFEVEAKHPGATNKPIEFNLKFHEDAASQEKLQEFQAAFEKGLPIEIDKSYISEINMPEFLRALIGDVSKLEVKFNHPLKPVPICLDIESKERAKLHFNTLLKIERAGSKEVLLSNEHLKQPWKIELLFDMKKNLVHPNFSFSLHEGNAHQLLEAAQIWQAFSRSSTVIISAAETGIVFLQNNTDKNFIEKRIKAPETWLIQLLEDLDFVQRTTHVILYPPKGKIKQDEIAQLQYVVQLLQTGRYATKKIQLTNTLKRVDIQQILKSNEDKQDSPFTTCALGHIEMIFNQPVPLGPIAIYVSKSRISESCLKQIQIDILDTSREKFKIVFESTDDSEVEIFSLNHLPKNVKVPLEIQKMLDDKVVDELQKLKGTGDRPTH